ncbi:GIY-YIG nuclease family protein [Candidatus Gracilibacteria bacterium]|nr:GIY-YIG nuclease family protein [Candidatus Gracilibacteria bacterium]
MDIKNISKIPDKAGVYFFKDKTGDILYIGKAKDLKKRVAQYFSPGSIWKQEMLEKANCVDFVLVKNESEALYLEDNLIKKHKPYYNNMLKGSNSYAYIKITNEEFPQIFITRKRLNDGSTYIGPKHNTINLKKFLQYLRQVLQYRGCKISEFKKGKICSDFYFGLCKGRCNLPVIAKNEAISKNNKKDSGRKKNSPEGLIIDDYKKIINYITSFFRGDIKPIQKEILKQIDNSVQMENFERAAKLRDIYLQIENLSEAQTVVLKKQTSGYVFQIKKMGKWFVYVLLYFYEGKLIDIVRHKFHQDESDIASIVASITKDCGEFILDKDLFVDTQEIIGISKSIKKLSKSDQKDINTLIEGFFESYIISTSFEGDNLNNELLQNLKERYKLNNFPYHIECIDISHLSGGWTSGGLSCLIGGLLEKKYYRKYKITMNYAKEKIVSKNKKIDSGRKKTSPEGQMINDYESLKEVIIRRLKNKDFLPNLFIIDGGKGQLGIMKKIIEENSKWRNILDQIDFISIGKGEARKKSRIGQNNQNGKIGEKIYYFDKDKKIKSIDLIYDQSDKIIVKARDEAHRFANAYRKNQMKNEFK